jgi:hypothetical protein
MARSSHHHCRRSHDTARRVLRDLLLTTGTAGNLGLDAHLAAMPIEHGAMLCSGDWALGRFAGLEWVNPLAS